LPKGRKKIISDSIYLIVMQSFKLDHLSLPIFLY